MVLSACSAVSQECSCSLVHFFPVLSLTWILFSTSCSELQFVPVLKSLFLVSPHLLFLTVFKLYIHSSFCPLLMFLGQVFLFTVLFENSHPAENTKPKTTPKPGASPTDQVLQVLEKVGCAYVESLTSTLSEYNYRNLFLLDFQMHKILSPQEQFNCKESIYQSGVTCAVSYSCYCVSISIINFGFQGFITLPLKFIAD